MLTERSDKSKSSWAIDFELIVVNSMYRLRKQNNYYKSKMFDMFFLLFRGKVIFFFAVLKSGIALSSVKRNHVDHLFVVVKAVESL